MYTVQCAVHIVYNSLLEGIFSVRIRNEAQRERVSLFQQTMCGLHSGRPLHQGIAQTGTKLRAIKQKSEISNKNKSFFMINNLD